MKYYIPAGQPRTVRCVFRVRVPYDIRKRITLSSNFCSCNNRKILLVNKITSSTFTDPCKLLLCRKKGKTVTKRVQGMFPHQNILGSLEPRILLTYIVSYNAIERGLRFALYTRPCYPAYVGVEQCNQDNRQSSKKNNKYQLLYTYGCTS
jgi:hypothetical protein